MCSERELSHDELVALVLELRQALASTQHELTEVQVAYATLGAENAALREEIARLQQEVAKKGDPPSWAKANTPAPESHPRKKRAHNHARRCETEPDVTLEHAEEVCPSCGQPLSGGWEAWSRETLVFPAHLVEVVRHVSIARRCGVCGAEVTGHPDPVEHKLVGQHLWCITMMHPWVDARGMSLIAYLHIVCRLPLRVLQQLLKLQLAVCLSLGGLRYILEDIAQRGSADYNQLREQIRRSAAVHQDETGWRENGNNGYVWAAVTDAVRYFERHGTRSGTVPKEMLGEDFCGVVVCDGYAGYDRLDCQLQRCWTHLLRKGHELKIRSPNAEDAHVWVDEIKAIYQDAKARIDSADYAQTTEATREGYRLAYQARLLAHVTPAQTAALPDQAKLAKFLTRHINELFVFVQYPEVASENNPAERAIRPLVIARKVCGGTRSKNGSDTKMILMSLLYTAQARGLDPIDAVEQMLLGTPMFPASL